MRTGLIQIQIQIQIQSTVPVQVAADHWPSTPHVSLLADAVKPAEHVTAHWLPTSNGPALAQPTAPLLGVVGALQVTAAQGQDKNNKSVCCAN